ncbi:hypothetical protein [Nocardioides sp.]|uniref:hypothetical protein n=1 Tax=Nocardioides sp. TaxID=35761 RepID=UPI003511BF5F
MDAGVAFAAVACAHLGFQATVTLLVYPGFTGVGPAEWARFHEAHSRRIVPLVAVLYLGLLVTVPLALRDDPDPLTWLGAAGVGLALATTAVAAAPTHGRIGALPPGSPDLPARLRQLQVVDAVRCLGALVGAVGALLAVA